MRATDPPAFECDVPGPWGVDAIGRAWFVIHRGTLRAKRIGPVIGFSRRTRANYFDRAMQEARERNSKATKEGNTHA